MPSNYFQLSKKMLEGELDIENEPRTQVQTQAQVQTREMDQLHLIFGLVCVLNFFFTAVSCNYKTVPFLTINSILYMIFGFYIYRKQMDIGLYTLGFLITVAIIYIGLSLSQFVSGTCVQISSPTNSPTNGPTSQNSTG